MVLSSITIKTKS